jgi:biotin-[acetyl-CoA-carboxylase] ligase BirA-like protein
VLAGLVHPLKVYYYGILGSTNSHAMRMRREGRLFAPALVVTSRQTAGRGRSGHSWWSRRGSVTATWVLPVEEEYAPHQLPLIVGLALRAACAEMSHRDDIQLKWPNDVVCGDSKLGGVLCERCEGIDLVGIGLNLNGADRGIPASLRGKVVSLSMLAEHELDINLAIATITGHLKRVLLGRTSHPFAAFVQDFRKCDALRGRQIRVRTDGGRTELRGICEGIDRDGELVVRTATGLHRLISGSVVAG